MMLPMMLPLILAVYSDERAVIGRLQRRDPQALAELYDRYGRAAYSLVLRVVRDKAIAEDLVQETFLRVWNRVDSIDPEKGSIGPWLLAIARNRAIDYLRSSAGGGPSVKPHSPPGLWKEISMQDMDYVQSHGDDLHRRSLYTFGKRTIPPPEMINFDAANRETCVVRETRTDTPLQALNLMNDVTFLETGAQIAGRPSIGAWIAYGLGSESQDLPPFVVMVSQGVGNTQALAERQWARGFLPSRFQGVKFRSGADPVLYVSNPDGYDTTARRRFLDDLAKLNEITYRDYLDPEISSRVSQYEMAFRMQKSVPDLTDLSTEPPATFELYGSDSRKPGTYAANCILARRLAERGVRFIQLFHRGWDQHNNLPKEIAGECLQTDQASAALIQDLDQRGLLKDTLVVWGGEFGRRVYSQGTLTESNYGRDHHPHCFTVWMAGGGVKGGMTRRNGRLQLQRGKRSYRRARPARHDSSLSGRQPHQAHLQVSESPFPADACRRQRHPADPGVRRENTYEYSSYGSLHCDGPRSPDLKCARIERPGCHWPIVDQDEPGTRYACCRL